MGLDRVQMVGLVRAETMDGGVERGKVFWCTRAHAEHYILHKIAKLAVEVGPQETKLVEPIQTKKFSDATTDTQQIDSVLSNASGKTEPLSASRPAPASRNDTITGNYLRNRQRGK